MRLPEQDLDHILDHTRELWDEMRGERIFLTGGTGFFGHWLLESFLWVNKRLKLDSRITVLTRSPESFITKNPHLALDPAVTLLPGDIRNFAYPEGTFSHIIHAATQRGGASSAAGMLVQFQSNVIGVQHTFEFARKCETKKILFTSSGAVYGNQPPSVTHIPETYSGAPDTTDVGSAYGQSKRISEYMCAIYAQELAINISIARCFAFVGPYLPLNSNYAIGNFILDALHGSPIQVIGDGTPFRSYLFAADLAIWLWKILFKGRSIYPYNVGSEDDLTIAQLASAVAREIAPTAPIQIAKQPSPLQSITRYVPSTQRAYHDLELETWIPLDEAIRRTANFYKR